MEIINSLWCQGLKLTVGLSIQGGVKFSSCGVITLCTMGYIPNELNLGHFWQKKFFQANKNIRLEIPITIMKSKRLYNRDWGTLEALVIVLGTPTMTDTVMMKTTSSKRGKK